ncbi:MAG: class I SAM-dependent methyltransferase [Verrucomicrobiota bacterium]
MDLRNINNYWKELTPDDIRQKEHRTLVGGMWDEIGKLQFDFLVSRGLKPESKLLDVGCGSLRGGIHFVRYLNPGNYHGIDINQSLLQAGRVELNEAGLGSKTVHLHRTDTFDASSFGAKFDFAVSVSLITHLFANHIIFCFFQMKRVMHPGSAFYFTFFETPALNTEDAFSQPRGGTVTHFLQDSFHYTREHMEFFARTAGLKITYIGDWNHPRNQQMIELRLP